MNTRLNNDLKLVDFDKSKYSVYDGIYNLVVINDINKSTKGYIFKDQDTPYTILMIRGLADKLMVTLIGPEEEFIVKSDDLFDELKPLLDKLVFHGHDEIIMRLDTDNFDMSILKQLRQYGKINDIRFYVVVKPNADIKYYYMADLCCHYDTSGELVVTKNRLGPVDRRRSVSGDLVKTDNEAEKDEDLKMKVNLDNKLRLLGFNDEEYVSYPGTYQLVFFRTNYGGGMVPFTYKEGLTEIYIRSVDECTSKVKCGDKDYLIFDDTMSVDVYTVLTDIVNESDDVEFVLYITGGGLRKEFFRLLKDFAVANRVRFYVGLGYTVSKKSHYFADLSCQYNTNGELEILSNKLGKTTNFNHKKNLDNVNEVEREVEEITKVTPPVLPLDFVIYDPDEKYIDIHYKDSNSRIIYKSDEELDRVSKEVTRTIERIEKIFNKTSILVDVKKTTDVEGRVVEYGLRQNLDGTFVILKDRYFGTSKIKLPIEEGILTPARAISIWACIE